MQIESLVIRNFKSIREMRIEGIENALILVGKNNTGKTSVLDAIRAVGGVYEIKKEDFNEKRQNIEIQVTLSFSPQDLGLLHSLGMVSQYKRYELWEKDFCQKLPSYKDSKLFFEFSANYEGKIRYHDGIKKNNSHIREVFPKIYFIDIQREVKEIQDDLLMFQENELLGRMRSGSCMFHEGKQCQHCFSCIGLIEKKTPRELDVFETSKLLEYKMYHMNLSDFSRKVNRNFRRNGGSSEEICYTMECSPDHMFQVTVETYHSGRNRKQPIEHLSKGMKSIYMLSLLEAYVEQGNLIPSIIMIEDPEIFLHPKLQKVSSEILYRLSKKNQVIFSTHSPNLIFNFNSRQIRQIVLGEDEYSVARKKTNINAILDDLGYSASDLMNVSFVFIVEGRQDKNRLPLLLEKYYSEIYDKKGKLSRIAIITTNSCTNIKTYANLKYMNQIYMRDQFLMIRDGDGKNPEQLAKQLCRYYDERSLEDIDKLPKVTRRNVLILKYYSFENYFLNPEIMAQLGVIETPEEFYRILFGKWQDYLWRIRSGQHLTEVLGKNLESEEELISHMEEVKIYLRGHNLFDIFYGRYKEKERELLKRYIDLAPREEFQDILDAVDGFVYFDSRKRENEK